MTTDDIPPRLSPDAMAPFADEASVELAWRSLVGRPGRTAGDLAAAG